MLKETSTIFFKEIDIKQCLLLPAPLITFDCLHIPQSNAQSRVFGTTPFSSSSSVDVFISLSISITITTTDSDYYSVFHSFFFLDLGFHFAFDFTSMGWFPCTGTGKPHQNLKKRGFGKTLEHQISSSSSGFTFILLIIITNFIYPFHLLLQFIVFCPSFSVNWFCSYFWVNFVLLFCLLSYSNNNIN